MRLEQLYFNFMDMDQDEQLTFLEGYKERRHKDLTVEVQVVKTKGKGKDKQVTVSDEALKLLKGMGLI